MELRTCEFCGTEYDRTLSKCPFCGKTNEVSTEAVMDEQKTLAAAAAMQGEPPRRRVSSTGGARLAPKGRKAKQARASSGLWAAICIVLGIAVLAGLLYFVHIMGFFAKQDVVIQEQEDLPEYNYEEQQPSVPVDGMETEDSEKNEPQKPVIPGLVTCTGLTISQDEVTIDELGGRLFLTAVARPSDCEEPIEFSSSDDTVVTVNENGLITAVGPGNAQIIVSCGSQIKFCIVHCEFEVDEPKQEEETEETTPDEEDEQDEEQDEEQEQEDKPADPPSLNKEDFTLFYPGEEATLTVKNVPEGAAVTYVSSNTAVASVSNTGKVTAEGGGTATITVTVGDVKLTCIVRCNLESTTEDGSTGNYTGPFTISTEYGKLTSNDLTMSRSGETCTLSLKDANGNKVTGLNWTTANGSICTITADGKLKAVGTGTTSVSVIYGGKTYKVTVRCSF